MWPGRIEAAQPACRASRETPHRRRHALGDGIAECHQRLPGPYRHDIDLGNMDTTAGWRGARQRRSARLIAWPRCLPRIERVKRVRGRYRDLGIIDTD